MFYKFKKVLLLGLLVAGTGTLNAQCTAPSFVNVAIPACDSVYATWPAVTGALSYTYAVSTSFTPPTAGLGAATNSIGVGGLNPGTNYYVHVRTNCTGGVSAWMTSVALTCGTYCPMPAGVATSVTNNSTSVTWNTVNGVSGYEYVLDQFTANPTSGTFTATATANASGLAGGSIYYWHLRTKCNATTYSAWTITPVTTSGSNTGCVSPAAITAIPRRCDSVSLSWTAVPGATNYEVGVNQTTVSPSSTSLLNTNSLEWVPSLAANTLYYVHVRNACVGSNGPWKIDTFTTPACPTGSGCNVVPSITTTLRSCDSVGIAWQTVSGARSYSWAVTQSAAPPITGEQVINSFQLAKGGLTPSTLYYLHVRSNCRGSNIWKTDTFRTPVCGALICNTPASVGYTATTTTANVMWTAAANAVGYEYAMTATITPPSGSGTLVTALSQGLTGLTAGSTNYFHIRTKCSATSFSAWKTTQVITQGGTACLVPATITNNAVTATSANISWTAAVNAIGYEYVMNQTQTDPTVAGTPVAVTSAAITNLTPNTTYYFHLRTKCSATGYSPWKAATQVITPRGTGINGNATNADHLLIYPNPAGNNITIELSQKPGKNASLLIYSIDGQKVKAFMPGIKTIIDVHDLQSGIYFIRFSDNGLSQSARFIKK